MARLYIVFLIRVTRFPFVKTYPYDCHSKRTKNKNQTLVRLCGNSLQIDSSVLKTDVFNDALKRDVVCKALPDERVLCRRV